MVFIVISGAVKLGVWIEVGVDFLALSKVTQLEVVFVVDEDVARLQISVHDVVFMHVLKCGDNLGRVQTNHLHGQSREFFKQVFQCSVGAVLHEEVQVFRVSEGAVKIDDVWMSLEVFSDIAFPKHGLQLVSLYDALLLN